MARVKAQYLNFNNKDNRMADLNDLRKKMFEYKKNGELKKAYQIKTIIGKMLKTVIITPNVFNTQINVSSK